MRVAELSIERLVQLVGARAALSAEEGHGRGADTCGTAHALSGLLQGERGPRVPETDREGSQCLSVSISGSFIEDAPLGHHARHEGIADAQALGQL